MIFLPTKKQNKTNEQKTDTVETYWGNSKKKPDQLGLRKAGMRGEGGMSGPTAARVQAWLDHAPWLYASHYCLLPWPVSLIISEHLLPTVWNQNHQQLLGVYLPNMTTRKFQL